MARINQLQNSPINSPMIAPSAHFKANKVTIDPTFVMNSPLMNGKLNSIQGTY